MVRVLQPCYGGMFACSDNLARAFVLPGETVAGDLLQGRSDARVEPGCVHFGECGGCQYQHAAYPTQLGWKSEILAGLLSVAGLGGLPEIAVHPGPEWSYRNRIRLRVETLAGELQVGYNRRGTIEFLPIRMCPIAAPVLWRAAQALLALGRRNPASGRWLQSVSEVELFCLGNESRLQINFFLRHSDTAAGDPRSFPRLCEELAGVIPELVGAGAQLDPELNRRVRRAWAGAAWGAAGLSYDVAGRTYWVARGAFFQVNRFLVSKLVELACAGQQGGLAWDLFAGVGLFTRGACGDL